MKEDKLFYYPRINMTMETRAKEQNPEDKSNVCV